MFLLDTNHITILQRAEGSTLESRIAARGPRHFYVSIVSFHEQAVGWHDFINRATGAGRSDRIVLGYEMFQRILIGFSSMQVLPYDGDATLEFDALRAQGVRIGTMDLRIAATALRRGFTVLTANTTDFQKVPGLQVDDWSR